MRTDGLMVRVGVSAMPPEAVMRLTRAAVRAVLPGSWVLTPLSGDGRDYLVHRRQPARNPAVARAFEYARALKRHRDVSDCEPALVQPVDGIPAFRRTTGFPPRVGVAIRDGSVHATSSDGDTPHFACSTDHN